MTRRYADVEPKPVAELEPGDEIVVRRRVAAVTRFSGALGTSAAGSVLVNWDDGTVQTYDLSTSPSLEVVVKKANA